MPETVFACLTAKLQEAGVGHEITNHVPVFTSEEAAKVRGTSLASGAKALICRSDDGFIMFVLPADRRLASKQVRRTLEIRSLRFATADEVLELTGLRPGSIPPFGSLFGIPTFCDQRLGENERINFNAGDHAISISLRYADYRDVEQPALGEFSEP